MKKVAFLLFAALAFAITAEAGSLSKNPVSITFLNGDATLQMSPGVEFPCIGIHFSDKNVNAAMGTYLEVKRDGNY